MENRFHNFLESAKEQLKDRMLWGMVILLLTVTLSNIATKLSDAERAGIAMPFSEPVLTEVSSAIGAIIFMPLLFAFFERWPFNIHNWLKRLPAYFAASVLFSAGHVFIMVMIRKAFWPTLYNAPYEFFGRYGGEALYEYRKDVVTFLLILLLFTLHRQLLQARTAKTQPATPITLKSGATTILMQPEDFQFAKSAGNYAEIITGKGDHLARITLSELEQELQDKGCDAVRIHRSYIINRALIRETKPIAGGDMMVTLSSGQQLRASRRYKDSLLVN